MNGTPPIDFVIGPIRDSAGLLGGLLAAFAQSECVIDIWSRKADLSSLEGFSIPVSLIRRLAFGEHRLRLSRDSLPLIVKALNSLDFGEGSWGVEIDGIGVLLAKDPESVSVVPSDVSQRNRLEGLLRELQGKRVIDGWRPVHD